MRISKVYTRTGDGGETGLGGGQRVWKDAPRVAAFGTVDELNSVLGATLAMGVDDRLATVLGRVQNELFHLGSDLCLLEEDKKKIQPPQIEKRHIEKLEADIDVLLADLPPLREFILPGGSPGAAQLHLARTVCRRAEREVVALARSEAVGSFTVMYLNRLSDLLFVMARWENKARGVPEPQWRKDV
jgi:cob(I)alamin adenosyltransferase